MPKELPILQRFHGTLYDCVPKTYTLKSQADFERFQKQGIAASLPVYHTKRKGVKRWEPSQDELLVNPPAIDWTQQMMLVYGDGIIEAVEEKAGGRKVRVKTRRKREVNYEAVIVPRRDGRVRFDVDEEEDGAEIAQRAVIEPGPYSHCPLGLFFALLVLG
ncbi:hypothetical protein QOT17_025526 [Balamuthia mandrillaris]